MNEQPKIRGAPGDTLCCILSHSVLAPSPLNTQPWAVTTRGDHTLDLFLETTRLLPHIDPTSRQACISCGAFIENLDIAAREVGLRTDIALFPSSWPGAIISPDQPVAEIEFTQDSRIAVDPLFSWIKVRHTNRRIFTKELIPSEVLSALAEASDEPYTTFGFSADSTFRQELVELITRATEITLTDGNRFSEIVSYVRILRTSGNTYPDGYGTRDIGLHGIRGWLLYLPLRVVPERLKNDYAGGLLVRLVRKQAESAAAWGWIATKGNSRHDQVRAGRAYERVHLTAASVGLSLQPMTHILESYQGMEEVYGRFLNLIGIPDTHTVQVLFRLGYSDPETRRARRPVKDLFRSMH